MSPRRYLEAGRDRMTQSVALLCALALVVGLLLLATLVWVMKGVTEEADARRLAEARQTQLDWLCTAPESGPPAADCAAPHSTTAARADDTTTWAKRLRQH
jgi:hypothetical protein